MTETRPEDLPGADRPDYSLYDPTAAARLDAVVREVTAQVAGGEVDRREAVVLLSDGVQAVARDVPDVNDITVRDAVIAEVAPVFDAAGYQRPTAFEF